VKTDFSHIGSALAKDIIARCSIVFLGVAGFASITLFAGLAGRSLVESNREVWGHAQEIRSMVSSQLELGQSSKSQLDRFLTRYRLQHNEDMQDGINYILVLDASGRIVMGSRRAWDGLTVVDPLLSRTETNDEVFAQIRDCFASSSVTSSQSLSCLRTHSGLYFPTAESYTLGLPVRISGRDRSEDNKPYLVLVNFDPSIASGQLGWELLSLLVISILYVTSVLGLLALLLYRSLLPAVRSFAEVDDLTGLMNRRSCMDLAIRLLAQGEKDNLPYILAILDLDYFKAINDTYGHQCGDFILREVSNALTRSLHGTDLLARLGGEEFIVMAQCSSAHALLVMERLRSEVELLKPQWEGRTLNVTLSIGLTSTEQLGYNLNHLYAQADAALYRAKDQGRNRICWSSSAEGDMMVDPWAPGRVWRSSFAPIEPLDSRTDP
jgi:diguanylate cyclase (GGDEF)-like protein